MVRTGWLNALIVGSAIFVWLTIAGAVIVAVVAVAAASAVQ